MRASPKQASARAEKNFEEVCNIFLYILNHRKRYFLFRRSVYDDTKKKKDKSMKRLIKNLLFISKCTKQNWEM